MEGGVAEQDGSAFQLGDSSVILTTSHHPCCLTKVPAFWQPVAVSLVPEHKARCKMGDSDSGEDYEEDERIVKLVEKIGKEEAAEEVVKYLKEELGGKNGMVRGYLPPAAASCMISMRCAALT